MSKNTIIALLAIWIFVLVGCGAEGVEKVDNIEDIAGLWQRILVDGDTQVVEFCNHADDGTWICADSVEKVTGQEPSSGTTSVGKYWFEGPQYYDTIDHGELMGSNCANEGVYEILLLESGNLKYELIEDECDGRISAILGSGSTEGEIEWAPVP